MESIGIYEYNSKELIGHGAFAVVYRGRVKMVSAFLTINTHDSCRFGIDLVCFSYVVCLNLSWCNCVGKSRFEMTFLLTRVSTASVRQRTAMLGTDAIAAI